MSRLERKNMPPHAYFMDLAKRAPKVPLDDPRIVAYQQARQTDPDAPMPEVGIIHNNFYFAFEGMRLEQTNSEAIVVTANLARARRNPRWNQFVTTNPELVSEITDALAASLPYRELWGYRHYLDFHDREQELVELEASTGHPLGIDAIGMHAYDRLNPLLEQAVEGLRATGMTEEEIRQFYR